MILLISFCKHLLHVSSSGQFCTTDHKLCSSYSMFFYHILWHKEALVSTLLSLYFQCMPKPILGADQAWWSSTCEQTASVTIVLLILGNTINDRISIKVEQKLNTYIEILAHLVVLICIKKCAREVCTVNRRKLLFGVS